MAAPPSPKTILITGCSSGIGWAAVELAVERGHRVCATARREESVQALREWARPHGARVLVRRLDVTERATIHDALGECQSRLGPIDVLVNNAGYGQMGAVEDVPPELWRRQFETNLIGLVELTQAALPGMRARRAGRIINVSSVAAHATSPLVGPYSASKHALKAMSDALRMEVAHFGIQVVQIEPGFIATDFHQNAGEHVKRFSARAESPYRPIYHVLWDHWMRSAGSAPHTARHVARLILRACEARRPRTRYRITALARLAPLLVPWLPDRWVDRFLLPRSAWSSSTDDAAV